MNLFQCWQNKRLTIKNFIPEFCRYLIRKIMMKKFHREVISIMDLIVLSVIMSSGVGGTGWIPNIRNFLDCIAVFSSAVISFYSSTVSNNLNSSWFSDISLISSSLAVRILKVGLYKVETMSPSHHAMKPSCRLHEDTEKHLELNLLFCALD